MDKVFESVLAWWDDSGVDIPDLPVVPAPKRARPETAQPQTQNTRQQTKQQAAPQPMPEPQQAASSDIAKGCKTLDDLKAAISAYDMGEISDHARQAVFSRGNPEADIMVIGEAPGRDEDMQGKPFVGRSGQLLDKIFASIGLTEETLYITNVVNFRPPKNRNPKPDEIAASLPFIHRHMELIDPKIIVLVGGVSFSALTGRTGIMKNRGQWITLSVNGREVPTLPIYHPAFLLRQPALKKDAWHDMLSLNGKIGELG